MPASIPCPGCQLPLEITPDLAGQMVQCPSCGTMLEIPLPASPARAAKPAKAAAAKPARAAKPAKLSGESEAITEKPGVVAPVPLSLQGKKQKPAREPFVEIENAPQESDSWRGHWESTWTGLMQINVAIGLWYLSAGFAFFIELGAVGTLDTLSAGPLILTLGSLTATALGVMGLLKCASIPQRTGAKGMVLPAAWCGGAFAGSIILYLILGFLADALKSPELNSGAMLVAILTLGLGLATVVLVAFFLVLTAQYLDAQRVKHRLILLTILLLTWPLLNLAVLYLVALGSTAAESPWKVIRQARYFTLLSALGLGVWLIVLISSLASRIRRHFIQREAED